MNFIGACLLLHSDEIIAFYLLETLLVEYQLQEVYINEFQGLYRHCKVIENLISEKLPDLSAHLSVH